MKKFEDGGRVLFCANPFSTAFHQKPGLCGEKLIAAHDYDMSRRVSLFGLLRNTAKTTTPQFLGK